MLRYLIQDMIRTLVYIPFVLLVGMGILFLIHVINKSKREQGKQEVRVWPIVSFLTYLALMIMITFLSREGGSSTGIDLEIGASLRINNRNNALVLENVLLFVPYGFFWCWWRTNGPFLWKGICLGFVTSYAIEFMQLVTGRGIFQIDDMITNTFGCVIGIFLFKSGKCLLGK